LRLALLVPLALTLVAAKPAPRSGTLVLDAAAPFVDVTIEGVPLRLRVDLDQRDMVELDPAAASRLPVQWEDGFDADLGGERLPGRAASVQAETAGRKLALAIATHDRAIGAGVDGIIGPLQLPYAAIRFVRPQAAPQPFRRYAMTWTDESGLTVRQGEVAVQLALARDTLASRAGGILLARAHGGRWSGPYARVPGPFGIARPVRAIAFATPPHLLGFAVPTLRVRTADFGGGLSMPEDAPTEGDITISRRMPAQHRWPVVILGREYLDGCAEIAFTVEPPTLDLACPATAAGG
jgi:hypothetical protein